MGADEIIGFIITILAVGFLILKPIYDAFYKKKHPEEYAEKEATREKALGDFLRSLKEDMKEVVDEREEEEEEEEEKVRSYVRQQQPPARIEPKSRRTTQDDFRYQTRYDTFKQKTNIEERKFDTSVEHRDPLGTHVISEDLHLKDTKRAYDIVKTPPARVKKLLKSLHSPKDMVILHEIMKKRN